MPDLNAVKTALLHVLGPNGITEDQSVIAPWLIEWRDRYFGQTPLMIMPASTAETAAAVKICAEAGMAIMPQGGNTGLVGGNTPQGEILLSTRRLNAVRSVSPADNILIADAGVTLLDVQQAASAAGRKFPLSLASEGSCTIGGNLSTNAGGVHVIKYGTAKDLVTGVEAVLPNGEIYNGLSHLKKDNTGYDLSRLFLGAEGTLGIITAASLKLFPKPSALVRVMVGLSDLQGAMGLLERAQGAALTMFEIIPRLGLSAVTANIPGLSDPFSGVHQWYGVLDFEYFTPGAHQSEIEGLFSAALDAGYIQDAVIAQNEGQAANLLALRENMSAAQKFLGASIKHDVSVPVARVPEFMIRADAAVTTLLPECRPCGFGHLGDGNIHYNISASPGEDSEAFLKHRGAMEKIVHDIVTELDGSISAEHGIGISKKDDLAMRADPVKIAMLRAVKSAIDPKRIMNPRIMI